MYYCNNFTNSKGEIELNNVSWENRTDHASNHDINEHQSVELQYDENYHPWDDQGCDQQRSDTYEDQIQTNECYEEDSYENEYGPEPTYHKVSQSVRFPDDQNMTSTNGSLCQRCNGAGYITNRGNECNELQILADCTEQISVPFHGDNDEGQEDSM